MRATTRCEISRTPMHSSPFLVSKGKTNAKLDGFVIFFMIKRSGEVDDSLLIENT